MSIIRLFQHADKMEVKYGAAEKSIDAANSCADALMSLSKLLYHEAMRVSSDGKLTPAEFNDIKTTIDMKLRDIFREVAKQLFDARKKR